ncbi:MAG TPA: hypothetical protein PKU91_11240, partial [Phycisphaerales bacterium]|nr:hypothetical protein [Phycisphaerales bacterium]
MPSPRLLAKLVSASGGLSAAALARVREGDRSKGLEAVKPLMSLVVGSICVHSSPPDETRKAVDAYLQTLAERYGTIRRVLDALGAPRRKHPAIS